MEEKNKKISISTILLIIAIIAMIVMGVLIYKINNDKKAEVQKSTELQGQVADLNNTLSELQGKINTISETINNNTSNEIQNNSNTSSNENSKDNGEVENIILNGTYAVPNSDVGFSFSKSGKATLDTNMAIAHGTYKTTGKGSVEAHFTQREVFNDETSEKTITEVDEYEHFIVDDNKNVFLINSNGEKVQLEVYGEVDKNN